MERVYDASNIKMPDQMSDCTYQHIHISSSDRISDKDSSSKYQVQMRETFKYVTSVKLIDANIPFNDFNITSNNNMLYFQETISQYDEKTYTCCKVPTGTYEIHKLLNVLKSEMNKSSINETSYNVVLNETNKCVTISSNGELFSLIFTDYEQVVNNSGKTKPVYLDSSIGQILGFCPINLSEKFSYTGTLSYNLCPINYVSLHISTDGGYQIKQVVSTNDSTNDAFCVFNTQKENIYDLGRLIKHFNPPITFNRLFIEFRTPEGTLYDFHGHEHYFVLELSKVFSNPKVTSLKNLF